MHTLTFTQTPGRQRRFLSFLIPLFALFFGLGAAHTALAQAPFGTVRSVIVNSGSGSTSYNTDLNTPTGTAAPAGEFDERNFGNFDINTGQLVLNGGTFTIAETSGNTYTQGFLDYRIFQGTLSPATATQPSPTGSLQLVDNGVSGGIHTFSLTTASRNVLASLTAAGNPGTPYRLDIQYQALGTDADGEPIIQTSSNRRSQFTLTGTVPPPNGATITTSSVIISRNGDANETFNAKPATAPNFNGAALGSYDINNGQLILKGGTITTNETGTSTVVQAFLDYTVLDPQGNQVAVGSLTLAQSGTVASGNRTFTLNTAAINLATATQTANTGYVISVEFRIQYRNNNALPNITVRDDNGGISYNATFDVTGVKTAVPTVQANTILIDPNGSSNVTFYLNSTNSPQFAGADLSASSNGGTTYDVNSGRLLLNGTSVTTTEAGGAVINNVVLYYRTRLSTSGGGAYQSILLTQTGGTNGGQKTFVLDPSTAPQPNLIATPAVTAAGTYSVDIYFQANGTNNGTQFAITDPPTGAYTASFTVVGTPVAQTIWIGGKNDNWFDADNWSDGVPTATTNALVRDLGVGNTVPYPNIYSDVPVRTAAGQLLYDNTGSGPAMTRNLILGGTSQASRSITRLIAGRLIVYGDFGNDFASFIQRENTVIEFGGNGTFGAPSGNQIISGGSFIAVVVSGTGVKSVNNTMSVTQSLTFNGGILATDITRPLVSQVTLADRAPINNNDGAQLIGETDASYLLGFVTTIRQAVLVGETRTYGNIGLTMTFTVNSPGNVEVTRNTAEAYSPVRGRFGVRRIFGVRPSDQATNTGGLTATMVFKYLDSETKNLNGPDTRTPGTSIIPEPNLTIFVSQNSGNTFGLVGRDGPVDTVNNTVTRTGVRTFATFTLGDTENPLPVRLTAFDAQRIGNNALITWQTASEQNSKGYEVQVSTNGTEYRTLTFVPSASPNSVQVTSYRYEDTEANKSGVRYYRLRQIDVDGTDSFFAPKSLSFDGKATESTLAAYPNPFDGADQLHLSIQSAAGKGQLLITDITGRTIRKETIELTSGVTDLPLSNTSNLQAGVYMMRVTLPSGQTKNLKVIKR